MRLDYEFKRVLPIEVKKKIMNYIIKRKFIRKLKKSEDIRFLLIGTPLHGNLGDQAITIAECEYLDKNFPDIPIIEIQRYYFELFGQILEKYIRVTDILLIQGGGFLGTQWIGEEYFVRMIIEKFPNNSIVILPQTVFYENSPWGQCELEKSRKIYANHAHLCLCAREKISFELMKEYYNKNNVLLMPDIVLYLYNKVNYENIVREGVIFCFRRDKEKKISKQEIEYLRTVVKKKGYEINDIDTVVRYNIYPKIRETEVEKLWREFSNAQIIVTDRLHGMIFAAITRTPCIVLSNSNHKVEGVYEWIKELDYIIFLKKSMNSKELF